MSIGSTIKRLRREKNMTQEQLAEYLDVTSRAVSQWECDRTAPDLSMLPSLCHVFGVSSDCLLGIDVDRMNEEIEKIITEATELGNRGEFVERSALLREANRKYPRNFRIMQRLADSLVSEYSRKRSKDYSEVIALCEKILAECTDSKTRYAATETLAIAYGYAGKKDEMLKLADQMPKARFSYENFMVYRWSGNTDLVKRQEYIRFLIHSLLSTITALSGHTGDNGKPLFSLDERKALWQLVLDLIETLFPDGDYRYFAQYAYTVCRFFIRDALKEKDGEALWNWLDRCATYAIRFDSHDPAAPHTSPVLRGSPDGGWIMEAEGNCSQELLDWLTKDVETAFLRSDPRFEKLTDRLKAVAETPS